MRRLKERAAKEEKHQNRLPRPEPGVCWCRKLVFDETVARLKERAAKVEKRRRHARKDIALLLKKC